MEQEAHLRDAWNEALKKEVERFKIVTREIMSPSESFNLETHQMRYEPSNFSPLPQQPGPAGHMNVQLPPFIHCQPTMPTYHLHQANSLPLSETMHDESLGRPKGLEGLSIIKPECPSLSASESSSTV